MRKLLSQKISTMGIFLGLIFVLSIAESLIAPASMLNIRPGLSNIIVMYACFCTGKKEAVTLNILKSLFVLITRGAMAGILSFSGGMLSICVIIILSAVFKRKISYTLLSVFGAMAHNLGQLSAAAFIMETSYILYYIPLSFTFAVAAGVLTGALLKVMMPYLDRIGK